MLLPLCRNLSLHDTVSSVPESTGNVVSVLRFFQAGSRPVHCWDSRSVSVKRRRKVTLFRKALFFIVHFFIIENLAVPKFFCSQNFLRLNRNLTSYLVSVVSTDFIFIL